MESLPAASPEVVLGDLGEPPVMLMPPIAPLALPAPLPPAACSAPLSPLELGFASGEPPGTPGFFPSGEMATRAARFPGGGTTGAGGPGVAESATSVCPEPSGELSGPATSGSGRAAPSCLRCAARGAEPALICSLGRSGPEFIARSISPLRCSVNCTSGAAAASVL